MPTKSKFKVEIVHCFLVKGGHCSREYIPIVESIKVSDCRNCKVARHERVAKEEKEP